MPADIPEGFATIATFRDRGVTRARRIALAAAFAVPILLGTTIGFWLVRGQPDIVQLSLLAFTGGVLTTVVVEEIVPEAHAKRGAPGDRRLRRRLRALRNPQRLPRLMRRALPAPTPPEAPRARR